MKIVFWGTPKYSAENLSTIINAGYNVVAVVTQPDRKRGRGKTLCPSPVKQVANDFDIPVYTTESIRKDELTKKLLFNLKADVYLVVAFGQILPKEILDQPKLGCWNSHASLLPKWRGAAPIQWSIINDDIKTGICIMAMETGLDTGPVINLETISINDNDNLEILTNRLSKISSSLLLESLDSIKLTFNLSVKERLKQLKAIEQSNLKGETSYARQIKKEDYLIDWKTDSRKIFKKVQGLYPNAYTFHNGKRIKIKEVYLLNEENNYLGNKLIEDNSIEKLSPGEVIKIEKQYGIFIMTKDSPIIIKSGQVEGKKTTDGFTLSSQLKLSVNDIIGI